MQARRWERPTNGYIDHGPIAGEDHLGVPWLKEFMQGVCRGSVGQELNVIEQKQVELPVTSSKSLQRAGAFSDTVFCGEFLGPEMRHPKVGLVLQNALLNRAHEVGLTETGRAVDKERLAGTPGIIGYGKAGQVCAPVARANHESFKSVAQLHAVDSTARCRQTTPTKALIIPKSSTF